MGKFKSLQEAATKILSAGKFKAGVTHNGWKKGDWVTVSNAYLSGQYVQIVLASSGAAYNLTLAQIDAIAETREELLADVVELQKKIELAQAKIKYLDETKQTEFDETEFKVWNTLQLLKGKKNDLEKAKAIAQLINS